MGRPGTEKPVSYIPVYQTHIIIFSPLLVCVVFVVVLVVLGVVVVLVVVAAHLILHLIGPDNHVTVIRTARACDFQIAGGDVCVGGRGWGGWGLR
jgi:hypothetical protein